MDALTSVVRGPREAAEGAELLQMLLLGPKVHLSKPEAY